MGLAVVQTFSFLVAILGLRFKLPVLDRLAAPASALLVLNAAAVVGLYKFLTTRGPLWKIWNTAPPQPVAQGSPTIVSSDSDAGAASTGSVAADPLHIHSNQPVGHESRILPQAKWQRASSTVPVPLSKRPSR
jgi:hypothetical protein